MDEADGARQRRFLRLEPTHAVQVTAECDAAPLALGEALNLSAGGACLALQTRDFAVGDELILWMNFAKPRQQLVTFRGQRFDSQQALRVFTSRSIGNCVASVGRGEQPGDATRADGIRIDFPDASGKLLEPLVDLALLATVRFDGEQRRQHFGGQSLDRLILRERARLARMGHVSGRSAAAASRGAGRRQRQGWLRLGSLRAWFGA